MYEFREVRPRIAEWREIVRNRVIRKDCERATIATESFKKYQGMLPQIRRAFVTKDVCSQMTVRIDPNELICGNIGKEFMGNGFNPELGNFEWAMREIEAGQWDLGEDGIWRNRKADIGFQVPMEMRDEDFKKMQELVEYWTPLQVNTMGNQWAPDGFEEFVATGASQFPFHKNYMFLPAGHLVAGYKKIIDKGYKAIRDEAQAWLDDHEGKCYGDDIYKMFFYKAVTISCDAASILITRYAEEAERQAAECTDEKRKAELLMMADGLHNLAYYPARNFWEACQGIMMYQVCLYIDTTYPSPALGRFDQYVWPYLEKDLAEGNLTLDDAQEIVDAFFLKANCHYGGGARFVTETTGVGNTYQHTTIGGVKREDGSDATNPVTYMVLETVGRLKLHDPTVSLRFNKNSPDKLWQCAIETSKLVGGLPLYQNDEVIIPGLLEINRFELEDARDYAFIGCQEIVGCGNDYPCGNGVVPPNAGIRYNVIITMAINDGINPMNGVQAKVHYGKLGDMKSFDEVKAAYQNMVEYFTAWSVSMANYVDVCIPTMATLAMLSMSVEGCMEKGKDITAGGAKYNSFGGTATGLATVADSLTTIRYMVFDKKLCTGDELLQAVLDNWEGHEELRQTILNEVPHFGNADPYADEQMKFVMDVYTTAVQGKPISRTDIMKAGLYGAADHVVQGRSTWATPDGRKTGEPTADAASPCQGRDEKGPLAIFDSMLVYDHTKFMDGMALNMRMHPSTVSNQTGIDNLIAATKSYFDRGGMEVQYNVYGSDVLREAQENPDDYKDLVVRIAGYSAYFVEMTKELQDDIISRHENQL